MVPGLNLFLINGASGSGKTTLSEALDKRNQVLNWVHPDGIMDTPSMTAEDILDRCLSWASSRYSGSPVIMDCQVRPSNLDSVLRSHPVARYTMILLHCPRQIREQRLLDRGWAQDDFEKIDVWASILQEEARKAGHRIYDTSARSVESMVLEIERELTW